MQIHNYTGEYFQYDSDLIDEDGKIEIKLPKDGIYYMKIFNINIEFEDGYTPDPMSGFLGFTNFLTPQNGILSVAGVRLKRNCVLFPLKNLGMGSIKCDTYNKLQLKEHPVFEIKFIDSTLNPVNVKRIVVTIQIADKLKYLIK